MFRNVGSILQSRVFKRGETGASRIQGLVPGLLLTLIPMQHSVADFIPLVDGDFSFYEEVQIDTYDGFQHVIVKTFGDSLSQAERITDTGQVVDIYVDPPEFARASAWAETSAGGGVPQAEAKGEADWTASGLNVSAIGYATVSYGIDLIKLHPDAPDDPFVPLTFTSTLTSTGGFTGLEITNRATGSELFEYLNSDDGTTVINSGITVPVNVTIGVEVGASTGDGIVSASAPVFTMDPNFLVPFGTNPGGSQRFERAIDLYTVAYASQIGYAGDFATVTPLTDGCLPDPSILGPSGTQSVTGGETITCRALDPSGFRSYGEGVQNPLGTLSDLDIILTPGAIVRTDEADTQTIGLLGSNNTITNDQATILATGNYADAIAMAWGTDNAVENEGAIGATGYESHAITIEGENATVVSTGAISSSGDDSAAVYLEGLNANLRNESVITTDGLYSSAVVLEGENALIDNQGGSDVQTSADYSSGLVIEGANGRMTNRGNVETQGMLSAGMVLFGDNSDTLKNIGTISTDGADAFGILALGQGHDIENYDTEAGTGIQNRILTTGANAHGIALGLQESPPDFPEPGLLQPASGSIDNDGPITTEGNEADAIHALAANLPVTNSGDLSTAGRDAHAISIEGDGAGIMHTGTITTGGVAAHGLFIDGDNAVIDHGDDTTFASIETMNDSAAGILVFGDNAKITIDGGPTPAGIATLGEYADAVVVDGNGAEVMSKGEIFVLGNNASAIGALGNDGRFENLGSITAGQGATSSGNVGIDVLGDRNRVVNNKTVFVESNNSIGVFVQGDEAVVANGDTQHQDAFIGVVGDDAKALHVESNAPTVVNEGELAAEGDNVFGIYAEAGAGSTFQVTSDNLITVAGNNVVGMSVVGSSQWGTGTAGGLAPACVVTSDGKSKFINCGNIEILNSTNGTGMLAVDIVNTSIENQEHIVGSSSGLHGIEVFADPFAAAADNYIGNVDLIELSGPDSIGISVTGNANLVVHGTDTIAISNVPLADPLLYIDPFGETLFADGTFTLVYSEFDKATSTSPNPIIPRGNISVTGPNAIGIAVEGNDNRVGITVHIDPDAGPGDDGLSTTVTATGANSIGVKLSGNNNLLVNGGQIVAGGIGVLGGNGSESVDNLNLISGGVQLNGGDDVLIIEDGSAIVGTADGGLDHDTLIISAPKYLNFPATPAYEVDGSKFVNFEQLEKVGAGNARLTGTLEVDHARILQGDLQLEEVFLLTAESTVTVETGATLSGTGTVEGRVEINGGTLAPGLSTGALTIDGDLSLSGLLALEALGPTDLDELLVTGDMDLASGAVEVLLGFTPDIEDILELVILGGSMNIDSAFAGVFGRAAAGSGVAIGTLFNVSLGGQLFQAEVTSAVPVPAAAWLFGSALALLVWCRYKRSA